MQALHSFGPKDHILKYKGKEFCVLVDGGTYWDKLINEREGSDLVDIVELKKKEMLMEDGEVLRKLCNKTNRYRAGEWTPPANCEECGLYQDYNKRRKTKILETIPKDNGNGKMVHEII